jgi:hypothetical protein
MSIEQGIIDTDVYFDDTDYEVDNDSEFVKKKGRVKRKK